MRKWFGLLLCAVLLGGSLSAAFTAEAANPEYKWRFGQTSTRATQAESYKLFCELIEKYSNGRIKVEFFANNLLGTHDEIFHGVQTGEIEMAGVAPYVNLVPGGMFNWMPWTMESWEESMLAFSRPDGVLYSVLEKAFNEVGMHILFTVSQGSYGLGNNVRPIKKPEDLAKLKMRVSSSLGSAKGLLNMGKGTGMTAETVPWGELYNALSRKVVDGCWSMWPSLVEERHYEVIKYYTALDWMWDANQVIINKDLWAKLPADLKAAVEKAAAEAEIHQYDVQKKAIKQFIEFLSKQPNFQIYYPTPEEKAAFRAKADSLAIWEEICTPWLEKHYPGQNMTKKILDGLTAIHEKVLAEKAAKK